MGNSDWTKVLFTIVFFAAAIGLVGKGCAATFEWAKAEAYTDQNDIQLDDKTRGWLANNPDCVTNAVRVIAPVSPDYTRRMAQQR